MTISKHNRYKGWWYEAREDLEADGDCSKIYHYARGYPIDYIPIDCTPYQVMSDDDFKMVIDLKMPYRVSNGPLRTSDLVALCEGA